MDELIGRWDTTSELASWKIKKPPRMQQTGELTWKEKGKGGAFIPWVSPERLGTMNREADLET